MLDRLLIALRLKKKAKPKAPTLATAQIRQFVPPRRERVAPSFGPAPQPASESPWPRSFYNADPVGPTHFHHARAVEWEPPAPAFKSGGGGDFGGGGATSNWDSSSGGSDSSSSNSSDSGSSYGGTD